MPVAAKRLAEPSPKSFDQTSLVAIHRFAFVLVAETCSNSTCKYAISAPEQFRHKLAKAQTKLL